MPIDLEVIVTRVRDAVAASDAVDPVAVRFLLSQYAATAREDLSTIVGDALGRALEHHARTDEEAEWLLLFADAAAWSDDERVRDAAARRLAAIQARAPDAIEAALHASATLGDGAQLAAAVDRLEHFVGHGYEPGDGIAAADQFAVASALLMAFDVTGRLPYAMLAEELVQTAQRRGDRVVDPAAACRAARVFCRLAALHADEEYVNAAVIAPGADYRRDGARLLEEHAVLASGSSREAALYGAALAHWLGLH